MVRSVLPKMESWPGPERSVGTAAPPVLEGDSKTTGVETISGRIGVMGTGLGSWDIPLSFLWVVGGRKLENDEWNC